MILSVRSGSRNTKLLARTPGLLTYAGCLQAMLRETSLLPAWSHPAYAADANRFGPGESETGRRSTGHVLRQVKTARSERSRQEPGLSSGEERREFLALLEALEAP